MRRFVWIAPQPAPPPRSVIPQTRILIVPSESNSSTASDGTVLKWFWRFADAHGFEGVRYHDLRHTHATILLANNIDAVAVASRMGHEDATVTLKTYAHALRRRDDDAARTVQVLLNCADESPAPDG